MSCPSGRYSPDKSYRPEGEPVFVGNQLPDHLGLFTAGFIANFWAVPFHLRALKKHYCCERNEQHPILYRGFKSRFFGMANEPRFCDVEQHNVLYSVGDSVRPLTIKTFCFAVAHFCCVGNFTFYLLNITLYCSFVTVSLKELFRLFFQSIIDFKSYERNDIKGPTN